MTFCAYQNYSDSEIAAVDLIPEHWHIAPLKAVASCNDEVLPESTPTDYDIDYVEISGVEAGRGIVASTVVPFGDAPSRARRKVLDGDVIVSTVRTYLRAISPIVAPPENMIVSTGFAVIRPRSVVSGFLGYLFLAEFLIGEIISRSVGVSYPAINATDLMHLPVPLPPLREQRAIDAFLDRETGTIDALVEEQRRLIALLKEKRQAVISHAVTKGLDTDAPMKPSGIEWLGDVPAHWKTAPLKVIASCNDEVLPDGTPGDFEIDYVEISGVEAGRGIVASTVIPFGAAASRARRRVKDGDVIVSTVRTYLRAIAPVVNPPDNMIVSTGFAVVRPRSVSSGLLRYLFLSEFIIGEIISRAVGVSYPAINATDLMRLLVPLPPFPEQRAIAEFLDCETGAINALITVSVWPARP